MANEDKKKPKNYKNGAIQVALWDNEGKFGEYGTFTITRSYKVGNEFKTSTTFRIVDVEDVEKGLAQMKVDAMKKYGAKAFVKREVKQ